MPCYPAFALLLGCAIAKGSPWVSIARRVVAGIAIAAAAAIVYILVNVWTTPTPGDISKALAQHPEEYTLSLGHMGDLTMQSFAYLRAPLIVAGIAFVVGAAGLLLFRGLRAYLAMAAMMVIFFQAARLALVVFDPYMSSRPIAEALNRLPQGEVIIEGDYNSRSSISFYHQDHALILNGRYFVLEYGSYAPDAPKVFIDDSDFLGIWKRPVRYYLVTTNESVPRLKTLAAGLPMYDVISAGGKTILSNQPAQP